VDQIGTAVGAGSQEEEEEEVGVVAAAVVVVAAAVAGETGTESNTDCFFTLLIHWTLDVRVVV
jgi:hypothetical protein